MTYHLLETIDESIEKRSLLRHPFYKAWSDGRLSKEMLKAYACQYYYFVKEFPRMVSAVHSNTPDISLRQPLLLNLMDEELGSENHPALWMRFAVSLGATYEEVEDTVPLPSTTELVGTMLRFCKEGTFQEGVASLYAYESQVPEISRVKIEGLKAFYGITDQEAIRFFTVHQEADIHHSQSERGLIETRTPEDIAPAVERAATETAEALWGFLDGVYENYVSSRGVVC